MLIDTHCHLNFQIFKDNYGDYIQKALDNEIWMILVGTNFTNSQKACDIGSEYEKGVFASVGVHPLHLLKQEITEETIQFTTTGEEFDKNKFKELVYKTYDKCPIAKDFEHRYKTCGRVMAIGETGLDYYYLPSSMSEIDKAAAISKQKKVFTEHMKLASELKLPLIIHVRGAKTQPNQAYQDMIKLLEMERIKYSEQIKGVIHNFNGTLSQAHQFINMGFLLGIGGLIYDNLNLREFIKDISMNKIILETDSPFYLTKKTIKMPNTPNNITKIAEELAKIFGTDIYNISSICNINAMNLFNLVL